MTGEPDATEVMAYVDRLSNWGRRGADYQLGRWEFQFVVAPLRIVGASGSPVNPLAML